MDLCWFVMMMVVLFGEFQLINKIYFLKIKIYATVIVGILFHNLSLQAQEKNLEPVLDSTVSSLPQVVLKGTSIQTGLLLNLFLGEIFL